MKSLTRQIFILATASVLMLFIIFNTVVNLGGFSDVLRDIDWLYFILALLTMIPITILSAARWHYVISAAGYKVSFKEILMIIVSSMSLSIIPGRLGDIARSYPLRNKIPVSETIGTIVLEKIIDVSLLMILSAIGLSVIGYPFYGVILLLLTIAIFPLLNLTHKIGYRLLPRNAITSKIHQAFEILQKIKSGKKMISMAVVSSLTSWVLTMVHVYWLFISVGVKVPFDAIFAFHPLSTFAGLLPITLAGIGIRDSAMIILFKNFASAEQSLAVGLLYGFQTYWLLAILSMPLLYYFFRHND